MELQQLDTSGFLYNPKNGNSFLTIRKYAEFKKKTKGLHHDAVLQYVILMYDPASVELAGLYPMLPQRKVKVAEMVGLIRTKKTIPPLVEDMLIGYNAEVNAMIIKYLHLFNDPNIIKLASYKELFVVLNKEAFSGVMRSKLIEDIEKIGAAIEDLTEKVLKGKDDTGLRADLYRSMEGRALGIRPEDIAEKIARGEEIFPEGNPYGTGYKVGKLKFHSDK